MLDINKRVRCEGTTVAEMIEALQRLPQDGIVYFTGKKKGYIHCDPESKTIDFDTDDLSAIQPCHRSDGNGCGRLSGQYSHRSSRPTGRNGNSLQGSCHCRTPRL